MAVDTREKRASATGFIWTALPAPDGTVDDTDRAQVSLVYVGIAAGDPPAATPGEDASGGRGAGILGRRRPQQRPRQPQRPAHHLEPKRGHDDATFVYSLTVADNTRRVTTRDDRRLAVTGDDEYLVRGDGLVDVRFVRDEDQRAVDTDESLEYRRADDERVLAHLLQHLS